MINQDYLKNLNEAQKEVVDILTDSINCCRSWLRKNKSLTSRIANIIREKRHFQIKS